MRNIEVAIALLFGYFIAWLTRKDGLKYVTNANIVVSDNITFLWRQWFGIGFYSPALLREYLVRYSTKRYPMQYRRSVCHIQV